MKPIFKPTSPARNKSFVQSNGQVFITQINAIMQVLPSIPSILLSYQSTTGEIFAAMEASKFSAIYFKPQLNRTRFFRNAKNAVLLDCRERRNLPRFCNDSSGMLRHHLYARSPRAVHLVQGSRSQSLLSCQVTREESGGTLSGESILLNEQTLERALQIAIEEENYAQAAKIRDSLRLLQEDSKASVLAANARFYNSFRNGDLAAMQALWSKGDHVCVVHPGVSGISGNDLVMGSWEFVWADYEFPLEIEIKDVQVHVRGDVGYVTCIEMVKTKGSSWGRHFASNVFEKVDGQWFICIHHASYVDL